MSVIETPPKDRLAIQTVVAPFSEDLVRRAIEEELAREGQVYFIHNRVESIYSLATLVQKLVPKARVVVGHGQMGEKELESVMLKFIRDEADVLVSTTIVENGLDIPRANTILINRADRFGLAELYQLRGRVGRSNQRAYAYLLVPPDTSLTRNRAQAALRPERVQRTGRGLPHRRARSGTSRRRQYAGPPAARPHQSHRLRYVLPDAGTRRRQAEGRRIGPRAARHDQPRPGYPHPAKTTSLAKISVCAPTSASPGSPATWKRQDVHRELADRFGAPPATVENLLEYAVLKSMCERLRISAVERQGNRIAIRFHAETPLDPATLVKVVRSRKGIKLDPSGVLWLETTRGESVPGALRNVLLGLQGQS